MRAHAILAIVVAAIVAEVWVQGQVQAIAQDLRGGGRVNPPKFPLPDALPHEAGKRRQQKPIVIPDAAPSIFARRQHQFENLPLVLEEFLVKAKNRQDGLLEAEQGSRRRSNNPAHLLLHRRDIPLGAGLKNGVLGRKKFIDIGRGHLEPVGNVRHGRFQKPIPPKQLVRLAQYAKADLFTSAAWIFQSDE